MFAIQSKAHTTTQHTQSQLVFGRDAILNINQEANWQLIEQHKKAFVNKPIRKKVIVDYHMCTALETKSYYRTRGK